MFCSWAFLHLLLYHQEKEKEDPPAQPPSHPSNRIVGIGSRAISFRHSSSYCFPNNRNMNSILIKSVSLAVLVGGSAQALTPDGGKWHHPGSPFIANEQLPTRHVGRGGTRLQSDPFGMPSYGRLHENGFSYHRDQDFPTTAMADHFGRGPPTSQSFYHQQQQRRARGPSTATPPPPPQEPEIPEFERQSYFRTKEDFGEPGSSSRRVEDDEFFFGTYQQYGAAPGFEQGIPSFFQQQPPSSPSDFYSGRPSTSFHNRNIRPNFF